jgi:hypothetical protein
MKVLQFIFTYKIKVCKKVKSVALKPLPMEIMDQANHWYYIFDLKNEGVDHNPML